MIKNMHYIVKLIMDINHLENIYACWSIHGWKEVDTKQEKKYQKFSWIYWLKIERGAFDSKKTTMITYVDDMLTCQVLDYWNEVFSKHM